MAANELHAISNKKKDIKSKGINFDCTWNSRGWQAKEGAAAAIVQKIEKIIDTMRKTTDCKDCQKKSQKFRDNNQMTALEYMEWFINYNCYLNHTGSSQTGFVSSLLRTSHKFGEKSQVVSFDLKKKHKMLVLYQLRNECYCYYKE